MQLNSKLDFELAKREKAEPGIATARKQGMPMLA